MKITDKNIDGGRAFDWGRTSADYARYRDIYPEIFYKKIVERDLCVKGHRVLDLGTGTGVLPRNMYHYGAEWTGTDISENQITEAKRLASGANMDIAFYAIATEDIAFHDNSFDVITACQCFWYFDHEKVMPKLAKMLKSEGRLLILYMAWLPFEDKIAGASEELVLKYSPEWSGAREIKKPIHIPEVVYDHFDMVGHEEYDLAVPFTRETWHGRLRACRGVGASLSGAELENWDREHRALLREIAPEVFEVLHYAALAELKVKEIKN
ncbi:MAG: methyltransferase domain-containing protein [Clostridia bacterium]|nr:methyltransferase domain-containing protein [Clostridia bacterium]